ncbi:hypothetical protein ACHAXN_000532 [Cyclotella atomus]
MEKNINKYYPETDEMPKGHMNQQRKNVWSTKKPFKVCNVAAALCGKKVKDIFVKTYDVRETIFSDQTGQFPTRSLSGNSFIMVMVAILVEPIKSREDKEMIRAYDVLVKRLQNASIHPRKHVLENEISAKMKEHIKKEYKVEIKLVPPGNHRYDAAEVAIRNFKAHFLSLMAGTAESFPKSFWDQFCRKRN